MKLLSILKRMYLLNYLERLILLKVIIQYMYIVEWKCKFMYVQYMTLKSMLIYMYQVS